MLNTFCRFWEQSQVASDGMNSITQGTTSTLESELKSKVKKKKYVYK